MTVWEILLIGVALSMDAVATSIGDGMNEPRMSPLKAVLIAGAFGLFQFLMPVAGYYGGYAFADAVAQIAPWLSFVLLSYLGGKMIWDGIAQKDGGMLLQKKSSGAGQIFLQAVATSIDAFAVGVTLLAAETTQGLPDHVTLCSVLIGETTMLLSLLALGLGRRAGNRFSDEATTAGGAILLLIGIKILLQSFV